MKSCLWCGCEGSVWHNGPVPEPGSVWPPPPRRLPHLRHPPAAHRQPAQRPQSAGRGHCRREHQVKVILYTVREEMKCNGDSEIVHDSSWYYTRKSEKHELIRAASRESRNVWEENTNVVWAVWQLPFDYCVRLTGWVWFGCTLCPSGWHNPLQWYTQLKELNSADDICLFLLYILTQCSFTNQKVIRGKFYITHLLNFFYKIMRNFFMDIKLISPCTLWRLYDNEHPLHTVKNICWCRILIPIVVGLVLVVVVPIVGLAYCCCCCNSKPRDKKKVGMLLSSNIYCNVQKGQFILYLILSYYKKQLKNATNTL